MREMKDSGIEWVGAIPATWKIHPLYYYFCERKCKNTLGKENKLLSLSYGRVIRKDINTVDGLLPENYNGYNIIEKDDIVLRLTDLQNDKRSLRTGLVREHGIITSAYTTIKANRELVPEFFQYLLHSYDVMKVLYNMGSGVRQGLNFSELSKMPLISPDMLEQKKIADFLDIKCSEIDALSADIQKEIETLEQYKRSVIAEAVTKGLNPDVKMESVNIQYIVKKPSNWGILRLKYVLTEQKARTMTGAEDLLSVSQYKGVILATDNIMRTMQAASLKGYRIVHIGDLVFNKLNPGLARFGASDYNGITSPDYAVYKANPRIAYAKYLEYILKTERYVSEYKRQSTGVGDGFSRLYTYQLYEIKVALPPIDEQKEIIDYLQSICYKIETAIQEKKKQVDILNAYKKSLIYEYVTGKKEVPNEQ